MRTKAEELKEIGPCRDPAPRNNSGSRYHPLYHFFKACSTPAISVGASP